MRAIAKECAVGEKKRRTPRKALRGDGTRSRPSSGEVRRGGNYAPDRFVVSMEHKWRQRGPKSMAYSALQRSFPTVGQGNRHGNFAVALKT
ncbi:hypothetical protein GCM10022293_35760 [Azospirillum formosense]